jgi:RNA polymerase sigma-70 factor (ECF subfamily)
MKETGQYTDVEIIQKILTGELALFEVLIRRYNPFLYKTGRSYSYSHEDTQDLMQDTFIDAYTNLSKFQNRASFKTWIIKIMLNNCFRKQQRSGFKKELVTEINDNSVPMFANRQNTDTNKTVMNR